MTIPTNVDTPRLYRASTPARIDDAEHQQLFREANELLASTESGRDVAAHLADGGVDVRVYTDEAYDRKFPGSGASYQPAFDRFNVPESVLYGKKYAATVLAHEGQHALDSPSRLGFFVKTAGSLAGSSLGGIRAAARFDNPLTGWLDGFMANQNEFEVSAYRTQAQVAHELGMNQSSWSHGQATDGGVLPDDEIRSNINADPLYRLDPKRRLLTGGSMTLSTTLGAAIVVPMIAERIRPSSFLARNAWPIYAVGLAAGGAALLADQMRARELERTDPR